MVLLFTPHQRRRFKLDDSLGLVRLDDAPLRQFWRRNWRRVWEEHCAMTLSITDNIKKYESLACVSLSSFHVSEVVSPHLRYKNVKVTPSALHPFLPSH
ncbi:hypothetical protein ARMGADRAFT_592978 [Armillaria gallica]|uniref:Uncharacterized protein n=1 Tax=Armillaria gallica TaxID=47427 RepID=A0A2H3D172_ARMGA|nr:hypothetical protein ARMGADRAFT_592978 [Armillaria gallica]